MAFVIGEVEVSGHDGVAPRKLDVDARRRLAIRDVSDPFEVAFTPGAGVDVNTTSTIVVADASGIRKKVVLTNASDTAVWLNFSSAAATLNNGYCLAPGAVYSEFYSGPITAIQGGTGVKRVGVLEF